MPARPSRCPGAQYDAPDFAFACSVSARTPNGPHRYRYFRVYLSFPRSARAPDGATQERRYRWLRPDGEILSAANCRIPATPRAAEILDRRVKLTARPRRAGLGEDKEMSIMSTGCGTVANPCILELIHNSGDGAHYGVGWDTSDRIRVEPVRAAVHRTVLRQARCWGRFMHEMTGRIAKVLAGLTVMALPAHGQAGGISGTEIVGSVMEYRLHWIGDSTRFDGCAVYRAAGRPSDFPSGIKAPIQHLLDRRTDPCSRTAIANPSHHTRRIVLVDSLTTSDSLAHVYLTVHRKERTHRENYTVRVPASGGAGAGVQRVTLWGAIQVYSPRRPAGTLSPSRRSPTTKPNATYTP